MFRVKSQGVWVSFQCGWGALTNMHERSLHTETCQGRVVLGDLFMQVLRLWSARKNGPVIVNSFAGADAERQTTIQS